MVASRPLPQRRLRLCRRLPRLCRQNAADVSIATETGRRLLLAVDTSGSMAAQDMAGRMSRLQVVKAVAGDFIRRRHGDQVGLIMFGTRPYLQAPLSSLENPW